MTQEQYLKFKNMSPEDKEDQYTRMGLPPIRRRKLYFKTVELFPYCIAKYFRTIITIFVLKRT